MLSALNVYPNPVEDKFKITFNEIGASLYIRISNTLGQTLRQFEAGMDQLVVDIADFPKGVYIVSAGVEAVMIVKE